jgi:HSP20 family protein
MTTDVKKLAKNNYDTERPIIVPPVDIYETDNEYVIKTEMPGVTKEHIDVTLNNRELEITGKINGTMPDTKNLKYSEFRLYDFHRKFKVGDYIDSGKLTAKLENGILTLNLPKSEKVKPNKIDIKVEH